MVIQNTDTTNGSVTFANGVQVNTKVTVSKPVAGSITVAIGTIQAASATPYTPGAGVNITALHTAPGNVFPGLNTPAGAIVGPPAAPNATLNASGANVILSSPNAARQITFGSNVVIKADPPTGSMLVAPGVDVLIPQAEGTTGAGTPAPAASTPPVMSPAGSSTIQPSWRSSTVNNRDVNVNTTTGTTAPAVPVTIDRESETGRNTLPVTNWANLTGGTAAFDPESIVIFRGLSVRTGVEMLQHNAALPVGSPAGELRPISYVTPTAQSTGSQVAPCEISARQKQSPLETLNTLRAGGVDAGIGTNGAAILLRKGIVLFAPEEDLTAETSFGRMSIAAGSVVLVVALHNGVVIYDMHDARSGDVVVSTANRTVTLAPGHHLTIAGSGVSSFEMINPLECIAHRNLKDTPISSAVTQFSSEFSITSALNGLKPLLQLSRSNHPADRRIVRQMIRDAAIIMQTRSLNGGYHKINSPQPIRTALR